MLHRLLRRLAADQRAATATEYALSIVLIGMAALTAFVNLGDSVSTHYSEVDSTVADAVD